MILTGLAMADPATSADPLIRFLGPGISIGTVVGGLGYVMREWRTGRAFRVTDAEKRAAEAEAREEDAARRVIDAELRADVVLAAVRRELAELRAELSAVRRVMLEDRRKADETFRQQQEEHATEMRDQFRRLERETGVAWRLREWIVSGQARNSTLPPDLDTERPEVPPRPDTGAGHPGTAPGPPSTAAPDVASTTRPPRRDTPDDPHYVIQ